MNLFWLSEFNHLKLLYLKMFLDGCIENFGNFMFKKNRAKIVIFSPKIGMQRRALLLGAITLSLF